MLFIWRKAPYVGLQTFVDNFYLTIRMGVILCTHLELRAMELEKLLPKIASEGGISIRHNRSGHAIHFENLINEDLSHQGWSEWVW